MDKKCKKCALAVNVDNDLYTVCEGNCAKYFHAACVGITEDDLCALSGNIIWMCDACMALFCRMRERMHADASTNTESSHESALSVEDQLNDVKCAVKEIADMLSKVIPKPNVPAPICQSTPVSSPKPLDRPNDMVTGERVQPEPEVSQCSMQMPECETFSLYLSNVDSSATENDISVLISRSLNVPLSCCNDVVKLVPKNKNVSVLEYVSFKAVLRTDLKPLALSASTWPKRIRYREFVNRMNETWKP